METVKTGCARCGSTESKTWYQFKFSAKFKPVLCADCNEKWEAMYKGLEKVFMQTFLQTKEEKC